MSELKIFFQRVGLVGISNILIALSSFILLPILTKTYNIEEYAIWIQVSTTVNLVRGIAELGLPYAMIRYLAAEENKNRIREGFYSTVFFVAFIGIIVFLILFTFSKPISNAIFGGYENIVILTGLTILVSGLNGIMTNYFRTFNEIRLYSIFSITSIYFSVLMVSFIVLSGFSIYYAVLANLISVTIVLVIMLSIIIKNIGFSFPKFSNIKEYLSFSIPTVPSNLSIWILDSSDRYLIGIILGIAFVGLYSPAYSLGNILVFFLTPFSILLPSILAKHYDNNNIKTVKNILGNSLKVYLMFSIPAAFGISVLAKPILLILTTEQIALNGYIVTPFIAASALLFGFSGIINQTLILTKKTKFLAVIWMIAGAINFILNIIFLPYLGIIGAGVTTLVAYIAAFALTLFYSFKFIKFELHVLFIIKSIIASCIFSVIIIFLAPERIFNIILIVLLCIFVYFISLKLLGELNQKEILFIRKLFRG